MLYDLALQLSCYQDSRYGGSSAASGKPHTERKVGWNRLTEAESHLYTPVNKSIIVSDNGFSAFLCLAIVGISDRLS